MKKFLSFIRKQYVGLTFYGVLIYLYLYLYLDNRPLPTKSHEYAFWIGFLLWTVIMGAAVYAHFLCKNPEN